MPSSVQQEWGVLGGGVDMVVVCKLSQWEKSLPVILSFTDKQPDVLFEFLVNTFSLSISLGVIGC